MDMGGLPELLQLLAIAAVVAALVMNRIASVVGVRQRKRTLLGYGAIVSGVVVGIGSTLGIGWVLLLYAENWFWLAYPVGSLLAYGMARGIVSSSRPPN